MKKILFLIPLLVLSIACNKYINTKNEYNVDIDSLNSFLNHVIIYNIPILDYYSQYKKMPLTPSETFFIISNTNNLNKMHISFWYFYYKDPIFSSKDKTIQYLPVYSRKSNKIEFYFIISSGIDGNFDNKITQEDTIYLDEALDHFKFYNSIKINNSNSDSISYPITNNDCISYPLFDNMSFKILKRLFGKKDVVLLYLNIIDDYISSSSFISYFDTLETEYDFLYSHNPKFYNFKAQIKDSLKQSDKNFILLTNTNYKIKCNLFSPLTSTLVDSVFICGTFSNFDTINNIIEFDNCIILDTTIRRNNSRNRREYWEYFKY